MNRNSARLSIWFKDLRLPLLRFLGRRSHITEADLEDLAQEVFLRLLRYDRAEIVNDPKGYLFRMADNVVNDWVGRAVNRLDHQSGWLTEICDSALPEDEFESGQQTQLVHAAVMKLEPRTREILRLHFGEGLKYEAIAESLSLSRRIVKREIARSYSILRQELGPQLHAVFAHAGGVKERLP